MNAQQERKAILSEDTCLFLASNFQLRAWYSDPSSESVQNKKGMEFE